MPPPLLQSPVINDLQPNVKRMLIQTVMYSWQPNISRLIDFAIDSPANSNNNNHKINAASKCSNATALKQSKYLI